MSWNPFSKVKDALVKKGAESAAGKIETPVREFVQEQKRKPLKGWRTLLINLGIAAAAGALHFAAGLNLQDLGLDTTTATVLMAVINALLRAVTTTPIGRNQ